MQPETPALRRADFNFTPDAARHPLTGWRRSGYLACKNAFDRAVAMLLLIAVSPLVLACIVIARMTSSGPAFYSQVRLGRNGRRFVMHKLRTMPVDSEARTGPVWSTPDDPRVTRFGRILRSTHLDELPQLWNVLAGDMSLIGPRPERPEIAARLERALSCYHDRLLVRPGLTGLAQVALPADSNLHTVRRKLAYDLQYVHRVGPGLDLRIAVATGFYLLGAIMRTLSIELSKSDGREADDRVESISILEDESCEIGTS